MFRSIRWTLQLWHAGILALALASFGTAMYVGASRLEMQRVDAELRGAAYELAKLPMGPPPPPTEHRREMFFAFRDAFGPDHGPDDLPLADAFRLLHSPVFGTDRNGPFDRNGPVRGEHRVVVRGPGQWMDQVPNDILRRFGQDDRNQPYFVVWGQNWTRSSSCGLNVPSPPVTAQLAGENFEPRPRTDLSIPPRQRGNLREVMVPGPFASIVLVGRSIQPELDDLRRLRWILIAAGAGVLAIGLAGGWLLSNRAIRPIHTITQTARAISASDLSRRIDLKDTTSELGSLACTLNQTFERLEAAFARQIRFTADASHELRTPITVIHSHAELALTRERTAPEYRQTLEACLRASKRMKSLVESLLVLARADAGKLELKPARFDLKSAAEDCLHLIEPLTSEKNVSLESDLSPIEIIADRTRVSQLLTNLLSNAIRYNRPAGSVKLSVAKEDSQAILTVADTGVGISPEDQRHVFERFFRADKARSREAGASGLGLAICQSIVEAHRGTISFTSQPGEGSRFVVRLPLGTSNSH
jgi:heavy metal sensor kinase